ncbi:MAG: hypothetical protein ACJAZY_002377 [Spirosomataceae bacterium]|jgi:hypothetical protein
MHNKLTKMRNVAIVLLSAFFLSCEEPTDIAFIDINGDNLSTFFTDTLTVKRETIKLDSAITSGQSQLLIGGFTDPVFGYVKSNAYFQVSLPSSQFSGETPFSLESGAVFDSLRLSLLTSRYYLGDTLDKVKVTIHRLNSPLSATKNYNFNDQVSFEQVPLVSQEFNLDNIFNSTRDSIRTISVNIPQKIGQELFALVNTDDASTTAKLTNKFPGFVILVNGKPQGLYGFQTSSTNGNGSALNLFYHVGDATTASRFPFDLNGKGFNQVTSNRAGTVLEGLTQSGSIISSASSNGSSYVQSSTAVGTRVTFPSLKNIPAGSLVNSATITFDIDSTQLSTFFPPINTVVLAELDLNNKLRKKANLPVLVNLGRGVNGLPGLYNSTSKTYTLDLTVYLQDVLNGLRPNTSSLVLLPGSLTQNSDAVLSNGSLSRVVIRNARLSLYYSKK